MVIIMKKNIKNVLLLFSILGIGVAYTTNKINPTMTSDKRIVDLLKEFYKINLQL